MENDDDVDVGTRRYPQLKRMVQRDTRQAYHTGWQDRRTTRFDQSGISVS